MNRGLLAPLQRRARQVETLRRMLEAVVALLELYEQAGQQRELTVTELDEASALAVRRERIEKSLREAGA